MIFIVAIVLIVAAVIAVRRGDHVWGAVLVLGLIPTLLTWYGFILSVALLAGYLLWSAGARSARSGANSPA